MTETKFVYAFEEGKKEMKALLGGKGANLADMTTAGLPVPPGFTISTESCAEFYKLNKKWPAGLDKQVEAALQHLEKKMGLTLGDPEKPLLVSVRSGAAASMPGMMDTILNLGMNDAVVEGVAKKSKNERFAWDSYRRFMQMFGNVVLGVDHDKFEHALESVKSAKGVKIDTDLNADDLKKVVIAYREVVKKTIGKDFPQDAREQLKLSINAVFESWNNKRAIAYRRLNQIQGLIGTAVNVQSMVFGNMGETSGTGVAFTRDPSTGENKFYGEFLMNAQGEDVVAGIRTPQSIEKLDKVMPECYKQLLGIRDRLEKHYKDMQDIEFTIQEGKLFMLQTRNGKRTAAAAVKIAVDLVDENICTKEDALLKIDASGLNQLLHKQLDPVAATKATVVATGLPASPGAAVGRIVFSAEKVQDWVAKGEDVILVRQETSPEDIEGMNLAKGILTARGGMTSHAAVVARGMGRCCVAGCGDITVKGDAFTVQMDGKTRTFSEGDWLSLDGGVGKIYEGKVGQVEPKLTNDLQTVLGWADATRKLKVRTNADTPKDAEQAIKFGAEGIGLCRTEHMFFEGERIKAMREMILSADLDQRRKALGKLLPFQRSDFVGLYKIMKGKPVTIRLLDPPLHEFLPHTEAEMKELAKEMGITLEKVKARSDELHEMNPMLGHRGCRLGITFPEITEMQARAIFEAAMEVKKQGIDIVPEVMIPLVGNIKELTHQKEIIDRVAREVLKGVDYMVGTMIEVPRAAVIAGKLATEAQFFSFGTNDLTQMTLGFSRDDAGKFLPDYIEKGVLETDPFQTVDQEGVGWLMKHAVTDGRATRVDMKCGICGEHGGDPQTIEFCHKIGLDYVSCSPFRVPIARLAAAQAAVKGRQ